MALHGKIEVNGNPIGYWEAVRKERVVADVHWYNCVLYYRNEQGYPFHAEFRVQHSYGLGALVLANAVIFRGRKEMKGYDLTNDNWKSGFPAWL